ncbi:MULTISPECIES: SCO7613 C-terminal domain-containing membrane protein [unclassified Streptomyces]|uniref:SCO7613 C-terminal domain-containing membrane protein n=1 Tax=unclassified Streptomyces TaxID=2593676 RepID=UPI0035D78B9B
MTNLPPPAEELRFLDAELRQLDARRAVLLRRREWLIHTLRATAAPTGWGPAGPGAVPPPRPEATGPGVQNVLLVLGGVLLTIAAIAFTLVSWGHMGITGRGLVLGALTVGALGAPLVLLRRGLRSTAEAVAGLGLALTLLDAYALYEVAFTGTDGLEYTAAASAVLAAAWAAYGVVTGGLVPPAAGRPVAEDGSATKGARLTLRLPLPLAVGTAHLPLLLWAVAVGAGAHTLTAVLLVTASGGTALALRTALVPVRFVAVVGALSTGAVGVLAAGGLCWSAADPGEAARAAALLVFAAVVALLAGRFAPRADVGLGAALAAGLCVVAGAGGVLRVSVPGEWTVPGCLACALALLAVVRTPLPRPLRQGLVWASVTVQGVAVLWTLPLLAGTLLGPVAGVERPWSGVPGDARDAVFAHVPWPPYASTVPLVLAALAVVLVVAERRAIQRPATAVGALVLGWAAVFVLPVVLELPYEAGLVAQGAVVLAALGYAEWARRPAAEASPLPLTALLLALVTSVHLAFLSLASESATLGVLVALAVLFGAAGFRPALGPLAAPAALGYAAALACAVGASAGWQPHHTALLVVVVPAVAALIAARLGGGSRTTVPVEGAGAAAGVLALALAVPDLPTLALVLALCGVVAAGTALRADRRPVGHAAAAMFLLATWVRLVAWEVTTPEAYTLPVTVPALVVGLLRRRREPTVSSWTAYGAGLAVTLLPSLLAAWGDPHWMRPLLLGAASLAATLVGARHRLQAPLLLGGGALALVALHELAPYIAQAVGALPRWVPPALAGLVLLVLGATYEQRLRDARRLRDALGRLH